MRRVGAVRGSVALRGPPPSRGIRGGRGRRAGLLGDEEEFARCLAGFEAAVGFGSVL